MRLRPNQSRNRHAGTAVIEFFFVTVFVMVPMMLGLWEMGRFVQVQLIISNAAREGARMAGQAVTINTTGTPTQILTYVDPTTQVSPNFKPNVKAAVMQYLSAAGLKTLNYSDVNVSFSFNTPLPTGAVSGATEPYQGIKGQTFTVTVMIQDTTGNGQPLKNKCLWPIVGFVNPTQISYSAQWVMLVDDAFSIDTSVPSNDVISN